MICPEGHSAEMTTRLIKDEPLKVEIRCDCQECGKSYYTTLYGSALRIVEWPQAVPAEPPTPEEPSE